jgi:hypothetical protein
MISQFSANPCEGFDSGKTAVANITFRLKFRLSYGKTFARLNSPCADIICIILKKRLNKHPARNEGRAEKGFDFNNTLA